MWILVWGASAVLWFLLNGGHLIHKRTGALVMIGDSQACIVSTLTSDQNPDHSFLSGDVQPEGLNTRVVCKIGSRVADWNSEIDSVPIYKGETVLIFLGSNEMENQPDPTNIIKSIRKKGGWPIWIGPPRIRGSAGKAPDFIMRKLAKLKVPYFDTRLLNLQQIDGVHPTAEEAGRWMNAIVKMHSL